jgi:hypothetical protein
MRLKNWESRRSLKFWIPTVNGRWLCLTGQRIVLIGEKRALQSGTRLDWVFSLKFPILLTSTTRKSARYMYKFTYIFHSSGYRIWYGMFFFKLQLDQPSLGLPSFILRNNNLTSYPVEAYFTFISGAALAIRDAIGGGANDTDIIRDIQEMINFHIELANVKYYWCVLYQVSVSNCIICK